jgi:RimJ/RimL family protein N-acetyltransferase
MRAPEELPVDGGTARPALLKGALCGRAQPELHADDLVLRPWQERDAPEVAAAYQDAEIRRWHARTMTEEQAHAWVLSWAARWQAETGAGWAVTRAGRLVGRVGLGGVHLDDAWAQVAYWVVPQARGCAVAPRAVRALAAYAFDEVGLQRLELEHATGNPASCRVADKAGFRLEGTKRRQALHLDGWHDMHLHALLADDPR